VTKTQAILLVVIVVFGATLLCGLMCIWAAHRV